MEHKEIIKSLLVVGLVALLCSTILCLLESYIYSQIDDKEIIIKRYYEQVNYEVPKFEIQERLKWNFN